MSDAKEEKPEAAGKGSRMKMIVGAVVLLVGGVGAGFGGAMALGMSGGAEAADHGEGEGEAAAEEGGHGEPAAEEGGGHGEAPAEGGHGEAAAEGGHGGGGEGEVHLLPKRGTTRSVVNLGTFTVNLRGSGGGRVLRTEVQVEVDGADQVAVEDKKPVLRDAVITLASDFTFADLEGIDGKTHLRDELLGRLNSVTSQAPEVGRVYFTEFVVQ
ncbi:MAG: flagellar basal body-associated FliL family protein [Myxococcota bacterium]